MTPVAPDAAFKARLHNQLVEQAARERSRRSLRMLVRRPRRSRLPWIAASAAVLGATATIAGAYAAWRWNASRQAA
jgi:hypothetical protein